VIDAVLGAVATTHVLVVDDASPDGTAARAEATATAHPLGRVAVLRRTGKAGLGTAYVDGFRWGAARGHDVLVQMDADSQHDPTALPQLLAAVEEGADVAVGSRYVDGGSVPEA
jgi:dolichol-phosphate mannosyltransferase